MEQLNPNSILNLRIQNKTDSLSKWQDSTLDSLKGELIVVTGDDNNTVEMILLGDGTSKVSDLLSSAFIEVGAISDAEIVKLFEEEE